MSTDETTVMDGSERAANAGIPAEDSDRVQSKVEDDETSSSGSSSISDGDSEEEHVSKDTEANNEVGLKGQDTEGSTSPGENQDSSTKPIRGHSSDLKSRLDAFLPRLERANAELDKTDDIDQRRIDHVPEDAEHYIEMNLGLGVLSEEKDGDERGDLKFRESSSEDEDENGDSDPSTVQPIWKTGSGQDILSQLKGGKMQHSQKRKIEELDPDIGNTSCEGTCDLKSTRR